VPVIAFRLDSISLPDAKAKQSKVQLTLSKFTYTVHPEFSWLLDLANFAKAPPGVPFTLRIDFKLLILFVGI
jgi:autophagy-related protein 2